MLERVLDEVDDFQFFPSCCKRGTGLVDTARRPMPFNSFPVAAWLPGDGLLRQLCVLSILSQLLPSTRTATTARRSLRLSILSQLLRSSLTTLSKGLRSLSILSQLLQENLDPGKTLLYTAFQFFPSCCSVDMNTQYLRVLQGPFTFNSFPVAALALCQPQYAYEALPFNSFPVAAGLVSARSRFSRWRAFNSFPVAALARGR